MAYYKRKKETCSPGNMGTVFIYIYIYINIYIYIYIYLFDLFIVHDKDTTKNTLSKM